MASPWRLRWLVLWADLLCLGLGAGEALSSGPASAAQEDAGALPPPAASVVPTYAFDRWNARTWTDTYAGAEPLIAWGGQYRVVAEYDIDFPVAAEYTISVRFAQAELRPPQLTVVAIRHPLAVWRPIHAEQLFCRRTAIHPHSG